MTEKGKAKAKKPTESELLAERRLELYEEIRQLSYDLGRRRLEAEAAAAGEKVSEAEQLLAKATEALTESKRLDREPWQKRLVELEGEQAEDEAKAERLEAELRQGMAEAEEFYQEHRERPYGMTKKCRMLRYALSNTRRRVQQRAEEIEKLKARLSL